MENSPVINDNECDEIDYNFQQIVRYGRQADLKLKYNGEDILKKDYINQFLSKLSPLAQSFDKCDPVYINALNEQFLKVDDEQRLPSSQLLSIVGQNPKKSFVDFQLQQASTLKADTIDQGGEMKKFLELATNSLDEEKRILSEDKLEFDAFLKKYFEDIKIDNDSVS